MNLYDLVYLSMRWSRFIVLIIILFLFNLLNEGGVFDRFKVKKTKEEIILQKISDDFNKDLPIDLDVYIRMMSTSVIDSNTILFKYKILDWFYVDEKTDKLISDLGTKINWKSLMNQMTDIYCDNPQMKLDKNKKINCKVQYVDLDDLLLKEFNLTRNDCN